jgi:hypothetical protein
MQGVSKTQSNEIIHYNYDCLNLTALALNCLKERVKSRFPYFFAHVYFKMLSTHEILFNIYAQKVIYLYTQIYFPDKY